MVIGEGKDFLTDRFPSPSLLDNDKDYGFEEDENDFKYLSYFFLFLETVLFRI